MAGPELAWTTRPSIRIGLYAATGVLLGLLVAELWIGVPLWSRGIGDDFGTYRTAVLRWLGGGGFYLPRQLAGPYPVVLGDVLYPPTAIWFLLPFAILPAVSWWLVAIGLLAWVVWSWRPAIVTWPLLVALFLWPQTPQMYLRGSPVIMVAALVAAGLRWHWPGALVLLKPSVLPFALVGIRSRGWWLTAGLLALLTLPLLPMIPDWLHAMFDSRGSGGLLYSLNDVPLLTLPVVAYLGRTPEYGQTARAPQRGRG